MCYYVGLYVLTVQIYLAELKRIQQQNYQEHQRMQEKLQTNPQYTVCVWYFICTAVQT